MKKIEQVYYLEADTFIPHQIASQYGSLKNFCDECELNYSHVLKLMRGELAFDKEMINKFISYLGLSLPNHTKLKKFSANHVDRYVLNIIFTNLTSLNKYSQAEIKAYLNK